MVPFAGLLAALEQIPDPRRRQGRRYPLPYLLLFSVLAVLAGASSYRGLRVFMAVHRERLNAVFGTALRRAPAVNTLRALFQALDPAELEAAFRQHARELCDAAPTPGSRTVALQGQRMRSAGDQRGHEVVVPGGGFALALEAGLQCRVGAREVDRDLAEQGQVPGGGALAHPASTALLSSFIETDVEHPVKSVLDRPMASYGGGELCRR